MKVDKQSKGFCGPASLKVVLSIFGIYKSEKYLAKICKTTRTNGTTNTNLIKAIKLMGLSCKIKRKTSIFDLKKSTKNGHPIIINWFSPKTGGHYSVVLCFKGKNIVMADPHYSKVMHYKISWFYDRWFDVVNDKLILREAIIISKKELPTVKF